MAECHCNDDGQLSAPGWLHCRVVLMASLEGTRAAVLWGPSRLVRVFRQVSCLQSAAPARGASRGCCRCYAGEKVETEHPTGQLSLHLLPVFCLIFSPSSPLGASIPKTFSSPPENKTSDVCWGGRGCTRVGLSNHYRPSRLSGIFRYTADVTSVSLPMIDFADWLKSPFWQNSGKILQPSFFFFLLFYAPNIYSEKP